MTKQLVTPPPAALLAPLCLSPLPTLRLGSGEERQVTPADIARFEAKIVVDGECWSWVACITKDGYGSFNFDITTSAHRFAYFVARGTIPDDRVLDHQCHNRDRSCPGGRSCLHRRCVNPAHLEPVTGVENTRRSVRTQKTECLNGHPYTPENTYLRPGQGDRQRDCRTCIRDRVRQYTARRKAVQA